jgi:hypothetical protein
MLGVRRARFDTRSPRGEPMQTGEAAIELKHSSRLARDRLRQPFTRRSHPFSSNAADDKVGRNVIREKKRAVATRVSMLTS